MKVCRMMDRFPTMAMCGVIGGRVFVRLPALAVVLVLGGTSGASDLHAQGAAQDVDSAGRSAALTVQRILDGHGDAATWTALAVALNRTAHGDGTDLPGVSRHGGGASLRPPRMSLPADAVRPLAAAPTLVAGGIGGLLALLAASMIVLSFRFGSRFLGRLREIRGAPRAPWPVASASRGGGSYGTKSRRARHGTKGVECRDAERLAAQLRARRAA